MIVEAMKRVQQIRQRREYQHIRSRQKSAEKMERDKERREVARDMALIRSPAAGLRRARVTVQQQSDQHMEEAEPDRRRRLADREPEPAQSSQHERMVAEAV
ncbi:putative ribosome biogenesis protein RLP24 [Amphibalanus amphitrite]|uniref:Putative ribosome biogenesis protein RLP24 n=1 Tax=Amphibalanus amphitrite TaxID=1232801 RepID=A0A6A4VXT3_AMPAM|nr:putative ribosome biogenesis protein RLP24 [Amphibalanus amphitrite]